MIIPHLFVADAAPLGTASRPCSTGARRREAALTFGQISREIWEHPEVGYQETRSAALLRDELKAAGFRITENVAGIPTAFIAEWGAGAPVIGIIGEYDALPGLVAGGRRAAQAARGRRARPWLRP
jgi:metal-dependent amidase/aminoacylase/carboxypeptidase family protein